MENKGRNTNVRRVVSLSLSLCLVFFSIQFLRYTCIYEYVLLLSRDNVDNVRDTLFAYRNSDRPTSPLPSSSDKRNVLWSFYVRVSVFPVCGIPLITILNVKRMYREIRPEIGDEVNDFEAKEKICRF